MRIQVLTLVLSGLIFLQQSRVVAQQVMPTTFCSMPNLIPDPHFHLPKQPVASLAAKAREATLVSDELITYIPIRPHIYRRSNGSNGIDMSKLNNAMAIANSYFLLNGRGIQFYFCGESPNYVDSDSYYYDATQFGAIQYVTNALNQYYMDNWPGSDGVSFYPYNAVQSTLTIIKNTALARMANYLLPHELGHTFNLVHTFGPTGQPTTELVTRGEGANCLTAGDSICDTPADPYLNSGSGIIYVDGCYQYNSQSTARDANGEPYAPSVTNMMSYYPNNYDQKCKFNFTPGQYERMQKGLALRRSHTAYSLDCPPTNVSAPTNVTTTYLELNKAVYIFWQDNATNEMGYFIERSTSAESGFVSIGGVAPNTTAFLDENVNVETRYYYRIRPSNTTTGSLSPVVAAFTSTCPSLSTLKSGNWNDPEVWSCGRIPTALDDVIIQPTHAVLLSAGMAEAVCRSLEILGTFSMQGSSISINGSRIVIDEDEVLTK